MEDDDFGCVILTDFSHLDEVNKLIDTLDTILGDQSLEEKWEDRLQYIFNQYQGQPHLLDPYLEILLHKCIQLIDKAKRISRKESFVFRVIYMMVKTRGYKCIIRLMPHEVYDLEPVLSMLADDSVEMNENWQARYVLLLWLSIVIMIPFDMKLFDTSNKEPISHRIIKTGKKFLKSKDVSQTAAAFMLSKFLCRPDTVKNNLTSTISWALDSMKSVNINESDGHSLMCGILRFFTYLFKFGKREDLLSFSYVILRTNNEIDFVKWEKEILLCRLRTKLIQRIGLIFLKMKVISWRYQRGNRILLDSLAPTVMAAANVIGDVNNKSFELDVDDSFEVSEYLDEVIDFLITYLKNYFTFVRWSAAKGLGRICSRLPKSLADEVVEAILVLFTRLEGFSSWHGGCLALAELGRRGLLLPQRLPEVLPLIVKALFYDEKSGECSYGANVRDAACYVCWSFARAYNPDEFKPYVLDIASALIMVILFDREVNVRRAASAAFQENVGRQGQFPHGIDILTTCDYFAVGNISNCFLNLSVFIASFTEYVRPLIDHLLDLKVGHWDFNIRELTAKAMNKLFPFASSYVIDEVLPKLINYCTGLDLYKRQGAIIAVGEIIRAVDRPNELSDFVTKNIKDICDTLEKRMQFRGLSGELMRKAVCHLIFCCSESKMAFHGDIVIDRWYQFLNDCLSHKEKFVRTAAIDAFPEFLTVYSLDTDGNLRIDFRDRYIADCVRQITESTIEYVQIAYLSVLGRTPQLLLDGQTLKAVLQCLRSAARIEVLRSAKWGEARSSAVTAITNACETAGITSQSLTKSVMLELFDTFLISLDDYTFDSHGDIGALVREASMQCLYRMIRLITDDGTRTKELFNCDNDLCTRIMAKVAQQAVEKIDRVRNTAGHVFYDLVHLPCSLPAVPHHDRLRAVFDVDRCSSLYWAAPQLTFPLFCQLLDHDEYRYHVVLGLVVSVGGMTENTVLHSRQALHESIKSHQSDIHYLQHLSDCFVRVFDGFSRQDRVICPLLKTVDFVYTDPVYCEYISQYPDVLRKIVDRTKAEIGPSKDIMKIKSGIEVLCTMLQFDESIWRSALNGLMVLMAHRFPVIRKHASTYLFQSLLMYPIVNDDKLEEINDILENTDWDKDVKEVREIRNKVCTLFGIPPPKLISAGP